MGLNMEIKVRVMIENKVIDPSELHTIEIKNPKVDRIINDIVSRTINENSSYEKKTDDIKRKTKYNFNNI